MLSQVSVSGSNIHIDISSLMSSSSDLPGNLAGEVEGVSSHSRRSGARDPVVVHVETIEHGPFKESYLEIRRREGKKIRIVTSIEVLSPSNKAMGNPGRELYLAKQKEVLAGETHLVEIDLLRSGTHTSAVPKDLAETKAGPFDYHISIYRFDRPKDFLIYPIRMEERLPAIGIPLLPGDPDVSLDVQAAFDRAYDIGPYGREIDYTKDRVKPRLHPDQAEWAARLIRATE